MTQVGGDYYRIGSGDVVAEIAGVGAALRTLRSAGRDLIVPSTDPDPRPLYRGILAAPWPNRIADGRYEFGGAVHQLPITESDRVTALHGLVMDRPWRVCGLAPDRLVLGHRLHGHPGYPFTLELEATYTVAGHGLAVELRATNVGEDRAPWGCTFHPYLRGGEGKVDDWSLEIPAATYLETDARGLPAEQRSVDASPYDFRTAHRIGSTVIDHAFTGLSSDRVVVRDSTGSGVEMTWGAACTWLQIYTSDAGGRAHHRTGLAVEPMTCPPDAFRSGTDVVVLSPGSAHVTRWAIRPVRD